MKYPSFLQKNGKIGLVAPSFGAAIEPYRSALDRAVDKFQNLGYEVIKGPNCYAGDGIGISSTPLNCGTELESMYLSRKNDILISCGGGEMMCEILDYVDFDKIKNATPKWYMGYSDNTNFTFLLTTLCDMASVYGPCVKPFGMNGWHSSIEDAFSLLHGQKLENQGYDKWEKESVCDAEHPFEPYHVTEPRVLRSFVPKEGKLTEADGEAIELKGRLLGGCMDCLVNLLGTKYDKVTDFVEKYKEDGIVWFLESCDLNVFSIRRAMWQMEHAGWFQYTKGFLIGRPLCHGQEMMGLDQYRAVTDIIEKYQVPVIMDADLGHLPPMMPIITGSVGTISLKGQEFNLSMELS